MKHNINGHFTAVDLFCGAGGVSQGLTTSKRVKILVAVNHSPEAIAAHKKNNPDIIHLTEDVKCPDLILPHLPRQLNLLWASAECTNYSNAKGGQSRNADSRTLPEYLPTYVDHCNPDYFICENVKEFLSWGPLEHKMKDGKLLYDKNDNPIYHPTKLYRGTLYQKWVDSICDMGYEYSYQLLNAADFGAHTNRTRYFGIFAKPDFPISFPSPTHSRDPGIFEDRKWNACREMINLESEGVSVFGRKYNKELPKHRRKPLVDKTMARIAYGLQKYHLQDFIAKAFRSKHQVSSLDEPLHAITTKHRHATIKVKKSYFISKAYGANNRKPSNTTSSIDEPIHAITTIPGQSLVTCEKGRFITKQQFGKDQVSSVKEPLHVIVTKCRQALVTCDKEHFLIKQQGPKKGQKTNNAVSSVNEPLHTIMTSNRHALITCGKEFYIIKQQGQEKGKKPYNGVSSIEEPLHTIMTTNRHRLVQAENAQFICKKHSGKHQVQSIEEPLHTILSTCDGKFIITINLNTRTKKSIYKEKIKFFGKYFPDYDADLLCLLISDIKMRYLTSYELADCTGFKPGTYLGRTETERKYHIGNAVPPVIPEKMSEELYNAVTKN